MSSAPQMRGFLVSRFKRDMVVTVALSVVAVVAWRVGFVNVRKQRYEDFYKTYDVNADFERMRKAGIFQSCGPDD